MIEERKKVKKSGDKKKDTTVEQINRSLGYLVSIAGNAESIYSSLRAAEPLLNTKLIKRLSAALHVMHKIKSAEMPNEAPTNN